MTEEAYRDADQLLPGKAWSITNPPPEGHPDVPKYCWELFEIARRERDRLLVPERFRENYGLYRGDHWQTAKGTKRRNQVTINLFFSNVQRTVANLTAKNPKAEVVDLEGISEQEVQKGVKEDGDNLTNARLQKWWKDTRQGRKLKTSCLKMEKYGTTIEKAIWRAEYLEELDDKGHRIPSGRGEPDVVVIDGMSFFPAPGNWEDIARDAPYVCHAYPLGIDFIEKNYGVKGVKPEKVYSLLGEDREDARPIPTGMGLPGSSARSINVYGGNTAVTRAEYGRDDVADIKRALVVEVWLRDFSTVTEDVEWLDERSGAINYGKVRRLKYPGGIRMVQTTNAGEILLSDTPNPSVNPQASRDAVRYCYLYSRFPFNDECSYEDTTSFWGFSAAEQTADLVYRIDEIVSKIVAYVIRAMFPPLVIPSDIGIKREMINDKPNLVLMPNRVIPRDSIFFVQIPDLHRTAFETLNLLITLFDRVYAIEDIDRGDVPKRIVAAAAIVALQERNAVLMQHKITSADSICEWRGNCAVSLYQNFGFKDEPVKVGEDMKPFRGTMFLGRKFNYVVEAGSTVPKTELQLQEQAVALYQANAIDRQALLETLNFPGWKDIIERVGEGMLAQAIQILVQAGLDEQLANELYRELMARQGGPGNRPQAGGQRQSQGTAVAKPGIPKTRQGRMPPQEVRGSGIQ